MMRRLFWRCVYPIAVVTHRLFGTSYKWVNVGKSAWMRPETGYGALWHYQWFGDPIAAMPSKVNLCGIGYRVSVAEGLVLFCCDDGMSATQFRFERDPHARMTDLWYCEAVGMFSASHFDKAYTWVRAVYGGSFEIKAKPLSAAKAAGGGDE